MKKKPGFMMPDKSIGKASKDEKSMMSGKKPKKK